MLIENEFFGNVWIILASPLYDWNKKVAKQLVEAGGSVLEKRSQLHLLESSWHNSYEECKKDDFNSWPWQKEHRSKDYPEKWMLFSLKKYSLSLPERNLSTLLSNFNYSIPFFKYITSSEDCPFENRRKLFNKFILMGQHIKAVSYHYEFENMRLHTFTYIQFFFYFKNRVT